MEVMTRTITVTVTATTGNDDRNGKISYSSTSLLTLENEYTVRRTHAKHTIFIPQKCQNEYSFYLIMCNFVSVRVWSCM